MLNKTRYRIFSRVRVIILSDRAFGTLNLCFYIQVQVEFFV